MKQSKNKIVAVSGYFNPIHPGHIEMFETARKHGEVIVIVNNDEQVKLKGSAPFMPEKVRCDIVAFIKPVSRVMLSIDKDRTVCKTLEELKPDIFLNCDDYDKKKLPEVEVCERLGIEMIFTGQKKYNSSDFIKNVNMDGKFFEIIQKTADNMVKKFSDSIKEKAEIRPWGGFRILYQTAAVTVKEIYVKNGGRTSLQYHNNRDEMWFPAAGVIDALIDKTKRDEAEPILNLTDGKAIFVKKGWPHRISSNNPAGGILIEVSMGKFDENDIVRLQDDYGRAK